MRPNIIFFLIDGLRADQCFGKDKTSFTPNIDSLRKKGTYFTNAFASVDGTLLSLSAIFHSIYPIKTPEVRNKVTLQKSNLFDILVKNGYQINGLVAKLLAFTDIINYFENNDKTYDYFKDMNKMNNFLLTNSSGLTDEIIHFLKSRTSKKPWFYYIHVNTLHPLKEYYASYDSNRSLLTDGIKDFNHEKFGSSLYERTVSWIDHELGKILEHIDLDNTIIILTADHGERIPYGGLREVDFEPKLQHTVDFGKKLLPKSAHKIGGQFLSNVRKSVGKRKLNKDNQKLTNYQKRSRDPYFTLSLFDEMIHIPLLFVGNLIKPGIITKQVRHVDIFPTICDLLDIPLDIKISGKSLVLLANESLQDENPNYLHTIPYQKSSPLDMVGVRTSRYKYFRSAYNANENVHLYDLKNDPYENSNIMKTNKKLVTQFEKSMLELEKNNLTEYEEKISDKEMERISNELKRLGYMKS